MKKLIVACAVVASAMALASSFQHQKKAIVLSQQYSNEDTPRPKRDTAKAPWPDTTKRPTPPGN